MGVDATFDLGALPVSAASTERPSANAIRHGTVLTAMSGVREVEHRVEVRLDFGLAFVRVEQSFEHRGAHPAEVHYRLPVPADSSITAFEVCRDAHCRIGRPLPGAEDEHRYDDGIAFEGPEDAPPIGDARLTRGARGSALEIRAAPITPSSTLRITSSYVASAPVRAGVARFHLLARGSDPRAAPAQIVVRSDQYESVEVASRESTAAPIARDAWESLEILGRPNASRRRASLHVFSCGERRCARAWAWAPVREKKPLDLILLLDASPSMQGPARGRIAPVLAALLAALPSGSSVAAIAFAARAEPISRWTEASRVRLDSLATAAELDLGPATRFDAAFAEIAKLLREQSRTGNDVRVVWLGDGGISEGTGVEDGFESARRRSLPVFHVDLDDKAPRELLRKGVHATGGLLLTATEEADRAQRGDGSALLEVLAPIFAPLGSERLTVTAFDGTRRSAFLRAGEEVSLTIEAGRALPRASFGGSGLRATTSSVGVSASSHDAWVAADAQEEAAPPAKDRCVLRTRPARVGGAGRGPWLVRACAPPPAPSSPLTSRDGMGMPAESLLAMFRQRIVPQARGCFRRDRAGRADYAVRTELRFELADREIVRADVQGNVDAPLRACLLRAIEGLEIPAFRGKLVVRYPLYTEREAPPPTLELLPEVADRVDGILRTRSDRGVRPLESR